MKIQRGRNRALALIGVTGIILVAHNAVAVVTSGWTVDGYTAFNKGTSKNAFVTSTGEVRPGWETTKTSLEFGEVWSAVRAADGTTYVGSDHEGKVYKISGSSVKELVAIADAAAIVSLALDAQGALYAGTMPGGQIWRIETQTGKTRKLATLPETETVWSLALGNPPNTLYAGTGPHGKLFAIDTNSGKAHEAFATEDKRILALAVADDGAVWLGTSDKAQVFRYDPKRKSARAIADFAGNEVSALAVTPEGVVATANDLKAPTTSGAKTKAALDQATKAKPTGEDAKKPKTGSAPGAEKELPSDAKVPRQGARKGTGTLYRVRGDGQLTQLHTLPTTYFTSIAATDSGEVYAGSADDGRVYLVDRDDSVSTVFDVEERYIGHILWSPKQGLGFTTGDAAGWYRAARRASNAIYVSDVFDAKTSAQYGTLAWRGNGNLGVQTRTGNTATPGVGWSKWQAPTKPHRGGGGSFRAKVASPTGRYFQYRFKLTGDDSSLRTTTLFYLPQNLPTRVTQITFKPKDKSNSRVTLQENAAKPRNPTLLLEWEIDNADKDETQYELHVRRDGESQWRFIRTHGKRLTETKFEWNTETFPDGFYRLRVTATDSGNNSDARALAHHMTTPLFLVDNTKPTLRNVSVRYPAVSALAVDSMSVVAEAAISINDEPWQLAGTQDGLFDDTSEVIFDSLPKLGPGLHTLAIRVADSAGNIGSTTTTFQVR